MATIKILLDVDLEELRNLDHLIHNTKNLIRNIKSGGEPLYLLSWVNSQERNLDRLEDLISKIEPLVER